MVDLAKSSYTFRGIPRFPFVNRSSVVDENVEGPPMIGICCGEIPDTVLGG